jgi:hypothetical protein
MYYVEGQGFLIYRSSFDHPVAGEHSFNAGNVKRVVYLRFKSASEVCNFHCENSDVIFPYKKMCQTLQKCPLIMIT